MTRVAEGASGWRIREIAGSPDLLAVRVGVGQNATETVMPIHEALVFAHRLTTIATNLRDTPAPSPELLDKFFAGSDEAMAGPVRRICNICRCEFDNTNTALTLFEAGVCSSECDAKQRAKRSGVEPPGGLERPHRTYKHGKGRR